MPKCPRCGSEQVRHRKPNLPANVRRRTKGDSLDRWVCDECEWSGDDETLDLTGMGKTIPHTNPMEV